MTKMAAMARYSKNLKKKKKKKSYRSLAVFHDGVPHVFVSRFIALNEEY